MKTSLFRLIVTYSCLFTLACAHLGETNPKKNPPNEVRHSTLGVETLYRSVARINIGSTGSGTAFAIGPRLLLTAGHVCDSAIEQPGILLTLTVMTASGKMVNSKTKVTIVANYTEHDLCLLQTSSQVLIPLRISGIEPIHGDRVTILGAPMGIFGIITEGRVARPGAQFQEPNGDLRRYLLLSCMVTGGNSGGPVLNDAGEVVGVLVAGFSDYPMVSLAVPLDVIVDFVSAHATEM